MRTMIVYYSRTGFTRKYAQWLAEDTGGECVALKDADRINFAQYDAILFGSWVHAGRIQKLRWFQDRLPNWEGKRTAVFAVGAMPLGDGANVRKMFEQSLSRPEREIVQCFYFQGGLNYEKMGWLDRGMMAMFRRMLAAQAKRAPENEEALRAVSQSYDATDRSAILPVVRWLAAKD